jgi:hypothetical protein
MTEGTRHTGEGWEWIDWQGQFLRDLVDQNEEPGL